MLTVFKLEDGGIFLKETDTSLPLYIYNPVFFPYLSKIKREIFTIILLINQSCNVFFTGIVSVPLLNTVGMT